MADGAWRRVTDESPFLDIPQVDWVAKNRSAFAVRDAYPVAEGHTLVIPRRLITTWWDAYPDEQRDLLALVDEVKAGLDEHFRPDGYNIGFNDGQAAGQTVMHLHIHVIPRRFGDVADPRGGVRHVMPGRGAYEAMPALPIEAARAFEETKRARSRAHDLIAGPDRVLHPELSAVLTDETFDRIDLVVSFVMWSGLEMLAGEIEDAIARGAQIRVLTTDYMGITEHAALGWMLDRSSHDRSGSGGLTVRIFSDPMLSFHPKAYLFWSSGTGDGVGFVGSSNMSRSGLSSGIEWNMRTDELLLLREGFERLWLDGRSQVLTEELLRCNPQDDRPVPTRLTPCMKPSASQSHHAEIMGGQGGEDDESSSANLAPLWHQNCSSSEPPFRGFLRSGAMLWPSIPATSTDKLSAVRPCEHAIRHPDEISQYDPEAPTSAVDFAAQKHLRRAISAHHSREVSSHQVVKRRWQGLSHMPSVPAVGPT